jgi:hypothetical protein
MLKSKEPALSRLRGFSEWMPGELVQLRMIASLVDLGHVIFDRDTGEVLVAGAIADRGAGVDPCGDALGALRTATNPPNPREPTPPAAHPLLTA